MTVKELVEAINAAGDASVTASLVQSTLGNYQIVLTGVEKLDLRSFVNDQRTVATNGNPSIARDPLVQHVRPPRPTRRWSIGRG